jgi:hypothetical protein
MKKSRKWVILSLFIIPFMFIMQIVLDESIHYPMWMDEYVFYRLSAQIPKYDSTTDWFYKDRPEVMNWSTDWQTLGFDYTKALSQIYDNPIYPHTPLVPILMSPITKGLNALADNEVIPHIEEQPGALPVPNQKDPNYKEQLVDTVLAQREETMTAILRIIPMILFAISLFLIFKLLFMKVGLNALLYAFPIIAFRAALSGTYLFYWDAFMMFFFVLTLYLMETRPNGKWHYLTACLMINTKMFIPMLFLIPLIVKGFTMSKKQGWLMFLPAFSILPFYIAQAIVSGDILYPFSHYIPTIWVHNFMYTLVDPLHNPDIGFIAFVVMTVPLLFMIRRYPAYATFLLITLIYGLGTGLGVTHLSTLVYSGALALPLIAGRFRLVERVLGYEGNSNLIGSKI